MKSPHEKLRDRRAIINRRAQIAALEGVAAESSDLQGSRAPVLAILKQAMAAKQ